MRKLIAYMLIIVISTTGCAAQSSTGSTSSAMDTADTTATVITENSAQGEIDLGEENPTVITGEAVTAEPLPPEEWNYVWLEDDAPHFDSMDDPSLLAYIEETTYRELSETIDSEDYYVEGVSAIYLSKEYIEEMEYNSKENIYFGTTWSHLNEQFQGKRFVFTLGEDGRTIVEAVEESQDSATDAILKNVVIGSGVILICVVLAATTTNPVTGSVAVFFAASARTATKMALSAAVISGVSKTAMTAVTTGDIEESLIEGAVAASEGYKYGAIAGSIYGGIEGATQIYQLREATKGSKLTINQIAYIQKTTKFPPSVIKEIKSMEEFQIYKEANLKPLMVNNRMALMQEIDLEYTVQLPDGRKISNLELMEKGYAPYDPATGKVYQLHHINQDKNGILAVLKPSQHQGDNYSILHTKMKDGVHSDPSFERVWQQQRKEFWKAVARMASNG